MFPKLAVFADFHRVFSFENLRKRHDQITRSRIKRRMYHT
jgi:hypothetical protein